MFIEYEFNKTLSEIQGNIIVGEAENDSLDERCIEIYNSRILREFTNEDLKVMIDHGIALEILMPFAIDILEENIMSEGEEYPGDLLQTVSSQKEYWKQNSDRNERLKLIIEKNIKMLSEVFERMSDL